MLKTIADPAVRRALIARLEALRPDSRRRWGTLTPHEMLCHLGDATDMVLRIRPRRSAITPPRKHAAYWIGLWSPLPFPRGFPTNPQFDPRAEGTKPDEFARDRARAIRGLDGIAAAPREALEAVHGVFGPMSPRDWQRWAYKHTDHHLRQFGL